MKRGQSVEVAPGIRATFWDAGHILGSCSVEVDVETDDGPLKLFFSGDVGPGGRDYNADPQGPAGIDHLIIESTYGDRERQDVDPIERRRLLAKELTAAHAAGGPLLLPAFAVERTQELLADLLLVMDSGQAPQGDVFLDSPLAIEATEVFLERGWDPAAGRNPFEGIAPSERLRFLRKPQESDGLDRLRGWHVILAASGMCDAGRVRKHLKRLLWREDATVLLSGFQPAGTLGRLLLDGEKQVRIQGEEIKVRARIRDLDTYSGHADASGLVAWALARRPIHGMTFIDHGEPSANEALRQRLIAEGFDADRVVIPEMDGRFELRRAGALASRGPARLAPGAATRPDWHNLRSGFLAQLNEVLQQAPDDAAREALIRELEKSLPAA